MESAKPAMTETEFERRVTAAGRTGKAVKAARLVLVGGLAVREAARQLEIDPTVTSRMVAKIRETPICSTCGQPIRSGHVGH